MKKLLIIGLSCIFLAFMQPVNADGNCSGQFVNPITDVCWSCMFPLVIAPIPVVWNPYNQKGKTFTDDKSIAGSGHLIPGGICYCESRMYMPGILMSFYEPWRSVDVTKSPFCLVGLGGIDLGGDLGNLLPAPGYGDERHGLQTQSSFFQVHWYQDPILEMLEILDLGCTLGSATNLDLLFTSEVDPAWNDDDLSLIVSPDVVLYTSLPAQMACTVDCFATSMPNGDSTHPLSDITFMSPDTNKGTNPGATSNPSRALYWCGGCQGSLFPLDGNNSDAHHEVQSTSLSSMKANMLMHRMGLEDFTTGAAGICMNVVPDVMMDKSEWKYSMTFPKSQAATSGGCCNAFGETDETWNSFASYPYKGENFNYLWFHQRDCCYF